MTFDGDGSGRERNLGIRKFFDVLQLIYDLGTWALVITCRSLNGEIRAKRCPHPIE